MTMGNESGKVGLLLNKVRQVHTVQSCVYQETFGNEIDRISSDLAKDEQEE